MRKWMLKGAERLCHYSNYWWYGPFIAFLAAIDAFILILSIEAILFPSVWAHPKKWVTTAFWLAGGSALGAVSFAILASIYGESLVTHFLPHALESKSWLRALHIINEHGALGLAFISLSPLPQQLGVSVAGLAHMNPWTVLGAVFLGRSGKYLILCWAATHTPRLLEKLHLIPKNFKFEEFNKNK